MLGMNVTIWLVRHGQTAWNHENRFQGHTDIPLNAIGLQQATALANALATIHTKTPFHAVYTSNLKRAHMTAEAIASVLNLTVHMQDQLKERGAGILEGLTKEDAQQKYLSLKQPLFRDAVDALPGVEPFSAMKERVTNALQEIVKKHAGEQIIVVTHGSALRGLYESFTNRLHHEDPQFKKLENTEFCIVSFAHGKWLIEAWAKNIHQKSP